MLRDELQFPIQRSFTGDCCPVSTAIAGQIVAHRQHNDGQRWSSAYIHRQGLVQVAGINFATPMRGINPVVALEAARIYGFVPTTAYSDWGVLFPSLPKDIESKVIYKAAWLYVKTWAELLKFIDAGGAAVLAMSVSTLGMPDVLEKAVTNGVPHAVCIGERGKTAGNVAAINPWGRLQDFELTQRAFEETLKAGFLCGAIVAMNKVR
jgi:hypothetical protein